MSKHTYEEVSTRAAAGDPVGISHLAFWDACNAATVAEEALRAVQARLANGDDMVTANMLSKAQAEVTRCEALRSAKYRAHELVKRQAPKDQVIAETVTAALASAGLPMEPSEHAPHLTVTATDHPAWDHITGCATGSVSIDYIASEWHRPMTEEEITNAVVSSPLTAGVSVTGGGSRFTAKLTAHRAVPEILAGMAQPHRWNDAAQGIKSAAQSALFNRYGMGHDDWGSTGAPRVGLSTCTLTPMGEERDGDVVRRKAEALVAVGYAKGVDRGESNGVVRDAVLAMVGNLWPALGVVESVEHVSGQAYTFTVVSRAKAA